MDLNMESCDLLPQSPGPGAKTLAPGFPGSATGSPPLVPPMRRHNGGSRVPPEGGNGPEYGIL